MSLSHFRLAMSLILFIASSPLIAGDKLNREISAVINAAEYKHAHWGILVVDLKSGETVYEQNADRLLAPASVTKLYSVACALDALGSDYRFETPIHRRGDVDGQGELKGDLILVASGDLTFGGRTLVDGRIAFTNSDHTYSNGNDKGELTAPDPIAGINDLARQVAASGIKRVRGDVLIDDRFFEKETGTGSGPRRLTPIIVNDNVIDITITPVSAGQPAQVTTRPATAAWQIDARVETVAAGEKLVTQIKEVAPRSVVVMGKIPAGHKPLVRVAEVSDPTAFARALVIEALGRSGVTVDASPLVDPLDSKLLPPRDGYASLPCVARLVSPPFSESARLILKVSHNLHASTLPLLVAAKQGKRTLEEGLRLQHDFLARVGVDVETISFGGGAGGSSADYVTPRATVQLLKYMHTRPDAPIYKDALPILGVDGTLSESVTVDSPAKGKAFAKTGTYYWDNVMNKRTLLTSKALAGYLTTAVNRELAFAAFVNHVHLEKAGDAGRVGRTLGRLCELIHASE